MSRPYAFVFMVAVLPVTAQDIFTDYSALEDRFRLATNSISIGVRFSGNSSARFERLGTVANSGDPGTLSEEQTRVYNDGYVSIDGRTTTEGSDLPDDGRTNTWGYSKADQIMFDESGVAFHSYSSTSNGASVDANSSLMTGVDIQYDRVFWKSRGRPISVPPALAFGVLLGCGLNDVNIKKRDSIRATLHTLTDTYSLLGSAVPVTPDATEGYTAPSSVTETLTNPDGTTTSYVIDTTTLLANQPESREETSEENGAEINGFWQVKGAYLTLRAGPWVRWQPTERLSFRFSAGASLSLLGLYMRYDERLQLTSLSTEITATEETEDKGYTMPGYFAGIDAEWWLTSRTSFFAGATYEDVTKKITLRSESERTAAVTIATGLGARIGITTRF